MREGGRERGSWRKREGLEGESDKERERGKGGKEKKREKSTRKLSSLLASASV